MLQVHADHLIAPLRIIHCCKPSWATDKVVISMVLTENIVGLTGEIAILAYSRLAPILLDILVVSHVVSELCILGKGLPSPLSE